jgi:two-component system, NtrC family, sensor kinase
MEERIRILFVDDERNVLRSLERTFMDEEYEILTAPSGAEGLSLLQEVTPVQVVISDYRMPQMNGVDFLREVCRLWPDTVRIVLSGYADTAVVISAINEGEVYKFIPKPWNDDELRIAIINALERYSLNKKNIELTNELFIKIEELKEANANLERVTGPGGGLEQNISVNIAESILQSLPLGIIGIDSSGAIVQCNREAGNLLSMNISECIGIMSSKLLPQALADFIALPRKQGSEPGLLLINDCKTRVKLFFVQNADQLITTLLLDRDERHD